MGDSNNLTVSTKLGDVVVHEMPLADYAELLRALDKIPDAISKLFTDKSLNYKNLEVKDMLDILPDLIAESWSDLVAILAVPTDKDAAFLGQLGGADSLKVIDAILELNDIPEIAEAVKKIMVRKAKIQAKLAANKPPAPAKPASST